MVADQRWTLLGIKTLIGRRFHNGQAGLPVASAAGHGRPGMFSTTDLLDPLAERGIRLPSSQIYRLVVERPELLSLKILMALLDILNCTMEDLIEPVAAAGQAKKTKVVGAKRS